MGRFGIVLVLTFVVGLSAPARAGGLVAKGPDFVVNDFRPYSQIMPDVAMAPDGTRFWVTWSGPFNSGDIYLRKLDLDGIALTPDITANPVINHYIQNEPAVATNGARVAFACSDFGGNDGDAMGIIAGVGNDSGSMEPEFIANLTTSLSQFEPGVAMLPDGTFLVAWSSTFGDPAEVVARIFNADGTPRTGDFCISPNVTQDAQLDIDATAFRNGGGFVCAFTHSAGAGGKDAYAIVIGPDGTLLTPEILLNATPAAFQKEPDVAASGKGTFVAAWETNQGGDFDVYARLFAIDGTPLSGEFVVHANTVSDQVEPRVACDWEGNFLVVYTDTSDGSIRGRLFDRFGVPQTSDRKIQSGTGGFYGFPGVACDDAGDRWVAAYEKNGDVYARVFEWQSILVSGVPAPGATLTVDLDLPSSRSLFYGILASLGTSPGIPLGDGRRLQLNADPLFTLSLLAPNGAIFQNFQGFLDAQGRASGTLTIPNDPALVGLTFHLGAITLDLARNEIGALPHARGPFVVN